MIFGHFIYFGHFPIEIPIEAEKNLPPWEGVELQRKQNVFWNQWSSGNNLGTCTKGVSEFFENKNHPSMTVIKTPKLFWRSRLFRRSQEREKGDCWQLVKKYDQQEREIGNWQEIWSARREKSPRKRKCVTFIKTKKWVSPQRHCCEGSGLHLRTTKNQEKLRKKTEKTAVSCCSNQNLAIEVGYREKA